MWISVQRLLLLRENRLNSLTASSFSAAAHFSVFVDMPFHRGYVAQHRAAADDTFENARSMGKNNNVHV